MQKHKDTNYKFPENYCSELLYIENKYGHIYNYKEETFIEKLILLLEAMPLFSQDDKKFFLRLLIKVIEHIPAYEAKIIAKLIMNGYYLDDKEGRNLRIDIVLRLLERKNELALTMLFNMMMVDDVSCAQYIINSINRIYVDLQNADFNIKSIGGKSNTFVQVVYRENSEVLELKKHTFIYKHDIVFIIPAFLTREDFLQPPIDALYAAKKLQEQGLDVAILDMRIHPLPLYLYDIKCDIAIVALCTYDIVQNYPVDYKFENAVYTVNTLIKRKEIKKVVAYGPYFDSNLEAVLKICHPDHFVCGPIEDNILTLVAQLFEQSNTEIIKREQNAELIDLNDYYCYSNSRLISPWIALYINRGCSFQCSFCYKHFGITVKMADIDKTINDLKALRNVGVSELFFLDSTFTLNREWTISFCNALLNSRVDISWQAETRIDCFDKELLEIMKKAGCVKLFIGIESFNNSLLDKCNKHFNITNIIDKIAVLNNSNLDYEAFFIVGLPGESTDNFNELKRKAKKMKIKRFQFITFMPRPKTKFYEVALKQYPFIKEDFRFLSIVRGIVDNNVKRSEIRTFIRQNN